jgi:ribosomal protein L44E
MPRKGLPRFCNCAHPPHWRYVRRTRNWTVVLRCADCGLEVRSESHRAKQMAFDAEMEKHHAD